jgi:hypothetical protein
MPSAAAANANDRPALGITRATERDVVRLTEGLVNKDIATRRFVSPRTVQTQHQRDVPSAIPRRWRVQEHAVDRKDNGVAMSGIGRSFLGSVE